MDTCLLPVYHWIPMSFSVASQVKPFFLPHQWCRLLGNWIIPLTQEIVYKLSALIASCFGG